MLSHLIIWGITKINYTESAREPSIYASPLMPYITSLRLLRENPLYSTTIHCF